MASITPVKKIKRRKSEYDLNHVKTGKKNKRTKREHGFDHVMTVKN